MRKLPLLALACVISTAGAADVLTQLNSGDWQGFLVENIGTGNIGKNAIIGDAGSSDQYGEGVRGLGYYAGVHGISTSNGLLGEGYVGAGAYSWNAGGYGVDAYAYAGNNSTYAYGIHSYTPVYTNSWAGYFNGKVHATGAITSGSDAKLKKNIRPIENGLSAIMKLQPKSYEFNTDIKEVSLGAGKHMGLIAQELETVMPELVSDTRTPGAPVKKDGRITRGEGYSYKSVNYIELIPVLIKGMQEQQATIERLQAEVAQLKAR